MHAAAVGVTRGRVDGIFLDFQFGAGGVRRSFVNHRSVADHQVVEVHDLKFGLSRNAHAVEFQDGGELHQPQAGQFRVDRLLEFRRGLGASQEDAVDDERRRSGDSRLCAVPQVLFDVGFIPAARHAGVEPDFVELVQLRDDIDRRGPHSDRHRQYAGSAQYW